MQLLRQGPSAPVRNYKLHPLLPSSMPTDYTSIGGTRQVQPSDTPVHLRPQATDMRQRTAKGPLSRCRPGQITPPCD